MIKFRLIFLSRQRIAERGGVTAGVAILTVGTAIVAIATTSLEI
jgi:hypothetical protein